jgi:sugar lactone lactonase YvrE
MLVPVSAHADGLTVDAAGNLFVADGHSVLKFTVDGTKTTFATGFEEPLGVSFDSKGNLFVSDVGSNSIYKLTPEGKKSTFTSGVSSVGMAFDRSDNLFVSHDDSIFKFTPEGVKSTFVSGLGNPIDLAFDGAGNLFVVDMAVRDARIGRSILRFSPDGTKSRFASGLDHASDVAVDGAGNLFVTEVTAADASSHSILKFSTDGTKNIFASTLGAAEPSGLACDRSGTVFVSNKHSILKFDSSGIPSTFASDWVSPDKQWEYRCADSHWPEIVKAGTTQIVLDLSEHLSVPHATEAEVVWAPDSKRFAFNYSPPHAPHTSYETIALYQLRGDKWVALRSPVAETSELTQLAQLAKEHFPKSGYPRRVEPLRDILKVRNWTDADTAILYAYSVSVGSGSRSSEASFLFTLKFDPEGSWKIVKTHQMSDKEVENFND